MLENLHFWNARIRLDQDEGLNLLRQKIDQTQAEVVVLDPAYTLHRIDENSASDVGAFLTGIRQATVDNGVAVLLVHHQGKKGESDGRQVSHRGRGSSAFGDAPDSIWSLAPKSNGLFKLEFEQRNTPPVESLTLRRSPSLWYEVVDSEQRSLGPTAEDVSRVLKSINGADTGELKTALMEGLGVGPRKAHDLVADAKRIGTITEKPFGKRKLNYVVEKSEPDQLHDCAPLESRKRATEMEGATTGFDQQVGTPC